MIDRGRAKEKRDEKPENEKVFSEVADQKQYKKRKAVIRAEG